MNNTENILVPKNHHTNKLKEKGSQFIGLAYRIDSAKAANDKLQQIRKKYYDATHHCYAFKTQLGVKKYSDDGEPNGTAGIRIMNAINHFNLTNCLVVVVRYFGGTKLGVGPLGKAYSQTASELLKETDKVTLTKYFRIRIAYKYEHSSKIHYLLNKFNCKDIKNDFNLQPFITCLIEPFQLNSFNESLIENTKGNASTEIIENDVYINFSP